MKIDSHQHFWEVRHEATYPWMSPDQPALYRDYAPADLAPLLSAHGIEGTILVQAAPTDSETDALLALAERTDFVKGVVGWCQFADPAAPARIAALARSPWLCGLRPMVQDIMDDDWLLREDIHPAFDALVAQRLTFDALVHPRHLRRLSRILARCPTLDIVIDHGAKPTIPSGQLQEWRDDMAALARHPGILCKLSGLVTECGGDWSIDRLRPVVAHLLDCFGPDRLMWGSDWPVLNLAGGYDHWWETAQTLTSHLSVNERDAVFGGNAQRFYLDRLALRAGS
ncbi:amidohydrolase family protein [Variovorax boronicumulans]|uniref:amidohydrolase family protein n=1 Tax=Variovorax boronicumulans TaxID=436515 RepID=UPI001C57BD7C